jgi:hypothetical protein
MLCWTRIWLLKCYEMSFKVIQPWWILEITLYSNFSSLVIYYISSFHAGLKIVYSFWFGSVYIRVCVCVCVCVCGFECVYVYALSGNDICAIIHVITGGVICTIIRALLSGGVICNVTRQEHLVLVEEYKDRFEPLVDQLERVGKWKRLIKSTFPQFLIRADGSKVVGLQFLYQVW